MSDESQTLAWRNCSVQSVSSTSPQFQYDYCNDPSAARFNYTDSRLDCTSPGPVSTTPPVFLSHRVSSLANLKNTVCRNEAYVVSGARFHKLFAFTSSRFSGEPSIADITACSSGRHPKKLQPHSKLRLKA